MAFTAGEITNIANAALDFYFNKGDTFKQSIQKKPLIDILERKAKTFPGGKGEISIGIKGNYGAGGVDDTLTGYTHDDTLKFYTPANIQRASRAWRELHIGMTLTHTELKHDGISVTDTQGNEGTSMHSGREMTALVGLLEDKVEDLGEQYLRGLLNMLWGDGTADAKGIAGLMSLIVDDPTANVAICGINQSTNTWWRNRSNIGSEVVSTPANGGAFMQFIQNEVRQLRRYGNGPDLILAGSDALSALEVEARANGYYSDSGFQNGVSTGVGTIRVPQVGTVQYDPWLDDNSMAKRLYMIDTKAMLLFKMEGEWKRQHTPARPTNQMVMHRSLTSTGQMLCTQRNTSGVYAID